MDRFNVIMAATKGEPDDNVKVGAYMAMSDPQIFRQFGFILRTMVPQIDRLCITTVARRQGDRTDGTDVSGPRSRSMGTTKTRKSKR